MNIRDERQQEIIARLFGPSARLSGSMGSRAARGDVTIIVNGITVGRGETLAEAIQRAQVRLSKSSWKNRRVQLVAVSKCTVNV